MFILKWKYLIFRLIFIQFAKTMRVAGKFFGVGVARNQDIEGKFIEVDAVWDGEFLPPQNINKKLA